ncbi:hypothetical protein O181_007788 [Austropuccinia psidii MF-1]|uniref:Uncharacterized protein n=1 Tax=Austropuccinia psidii MF-1 TaxID=1389203 RepID=A0A9Q3BN66_9BASI|nr:hypothetical protein [Austropuccinia psidii MF-1]
MANWPPLVLYGPSALSWAPSSGSSAHILPSLDSFANFHITNPQAFIFDLGPGGSLSLPGDSGPPSHHLWFWATSIHQGGLGLNGLFGPFRPPRASTARGPPQCQVRPKPKLDPPERILATNLLDPNLAKNPFDTKMAIEPIGPIFSHGPPWTIIPAMASGNHQRLPDQLSKHSPQLKGNSFIPPCTPYSRLTKSHNSKSRYKNPTPISKEDSLTHQSGNPWQQSEDHSRM